MSFGMSFYFWTDYNLISILFYTKPDARPYIFRKYDIVDSNVYVVVSGVGET